MENSTKSKIINIGLPFLFLMLVWGSSFVLVKHGLKVFSAVEVASLRLSAAMAAMVGFAVFQFKYIPKDKFLPLFISAVLAMGAPAYLFAIAQTSVSSSIAGVLNALTPLMTFIVGISFFGQKLTTPKIIGLFLGFLGSATLILVNAKGEISINSLAMLILIATVCYGVNVNFVKKYLTDIKPIHLSSITVTMVGSIAFCILLTTSFWTKVQTHPDGYKALREIILLGVLGTATAQVVFNRMLAHTSALIASSITYFIPIVAVMWGIYEGEVFLIWHFLGMALIIGGVLILNRFR
jgi:drug/metabolite transporter (DMT)-like permease